MYTISFTEASRIAGVNPSDVSLRTMQKLLNVKNEIIDNLRSEIRDMLNDRMDLRKRLNEFEGERNRVFFRLEDQ